jgi:hypothetical protein
MRFISLLLLSFLLAAPLAATDSGQPASAPAQLQTSDALAAQIARDLQPVAPEQKANFAGESDDICYKIRAYIFKLDDDQPPELVGSTTCGPKQPHAKNVDWPKARLFPAE